MSSFFVTGTDTNVGKTVVSRAIMQVLQKAGVQVVGYKPIAFGQDEVIYPPHNLPENGATNSAEFEGNCQSTGFVNRSGL